MSNVIRFARSQLSFRFEKIDELFRHPILVEFRGMDQFQGFYLLDRHNTNLPEELVADLSQGTSVSWWIIGTIEFPDRLQMTKI
ncbi:MAG: hypothetical protein HQM13_21400 [SAR324 cluster bacterium]|nr:hypothetical protein [SAR324 cluster bacterium]